MNKNVDRTQIGRVLWLWGVAIWNMEILENQQNDSLYYYALLVGIFISTKCNPYSGVWRFVIISSQSGKHLWHPEIHQDVLRRVDPGASSEVSEAHLKGILDTLYIYISLQDIFNSSCCSLLLWNGFQIPQIPLRASRISETRNQPPARQGIHQVDE